jgi:hypothetical protein
MTHSKSLVKNQPLRGKLHNPILADVPILNTTLIPPLMPMGEKEIKFADMVWSGLTPYFAYRETYGIPDSLSRDMVNTSINRVLWLRKVRVRINQLDKIMCDMDNKSAENRRNFVLDGLTDLAQDTSISPMARLKALELLGKVRGTDLFSDKVEHSVTSMTEEQVKQALAEKLALLGRGDVTDTSELAKEIKVIEHVPEARSGDIEHEPPSSGTQQTEGAPVITGKKTDR